MKWEIGTTFELYGKRRLKGVYCSEETEKNSIAGGGWKDYITVRRLKNSIAGGGGWKK